MLSDDDALTIEHERLRAVFHHTPLTVAVSMINAAIAASLIASVRADRAPAFWIAAMFAVSVVRLIGARAFVRRPPPGWRYPRMMFSVISTLMNGILWGYGATVLCPAGDAYQLFMALAVCGMCAGALTVNSSHLPTLMAFILPSSLPLAWSFFVQGPAWRVSSLMVIIFALSMFVIGQRAHRTFGDGIRLRLALGRHQRQLSEANARLQAEVAQRQTAEATLHQAQKMETIGHLTGGIAHDFNNLLQVMIGNLNLIRRLSGDNQRLDDYAAAAEQAAVRGAELTGSLLAFARRQVLESERVNLNALLTEFQPILLRTLGTAIHCTIELAADLPACHADPAHFQSAVLNLVINARDAMPGGGLLMIKTHHATLGPVELAENLDAAPGEFAGVSVRDTGFGMTAEIVARVFEPFFTTKEVGKGSGLGLSQVYGFARQSGGHIQLHSKLDEGTEAILWLPVAVTSPVSGNNPSHAPNTPTDQA